VGDETITPQRLAEFFDALRALETYYSDWAGMYPKKLVINPSILKKLASAEGFYQRPELNSEVTVCSPVVRRFKLQNVTVLIKEDYDEPFLHFE
jgi:hypothetical protein